MTSQAKKKIYSTPRFTWITAIEQWQFSIFNFGFNANTEAKSE